MFALIKPNGVDLPQISFDQKSFTAFYSHEGVGDAALKGRNTAKVSLTLEETIEPREQYTVDETIRRLGTVNETWAKNARRFVGAPAAEKADLLHDGFPAHLPYS